mmetsp:Transcript_14564/g.35517  ORF Transcript_14564/g.35517 Transcript_14564/m.35517 type:complete len:1102 (-) Transcript_14564:86-3391(-)
METAASALTSAAREADIEADIEDGEIAEEETEIRTEGVHPTDGKRGVREEPREEERARKRQKSEKPEGNLEPGCASERKIAMVVDSDAADGSDGTNPRPEQSTWDREEGFKRRSNGSSKDSSSTRPRPRQQFGQTVPSNAIPSSTSPRLPKGIPARNFANKSFHHYASFPPGWDKESASGDQKTNGYDQPARKYKFELDPFQRKAVECLEGGHNVLVAAHTSAGKTAVAEYAIAMAQRENCRTLYTTPIKALSNQKYQEFKEEFGDVGLLTGDVSISPHASIVILTTEVLRNMLYRGSEMLREAKYVVFDEVHYMRDKTRGVVWEESIIMLAREVGLVFLSATLSNANEFADWIAYIKKKPCDVITTEYRPVPLVHYVFPRHGNGLHIIKDEMGNFRGETWESLRGMLIGNSGSKILGSSHDPQRIIEAIRDRDWLPCILFCFTRRTCENQAMYLSSKIDFTTEKEKKGIRDVFENALFSLQEEDRKLKPIQKMLPILLTGVGVHHSGLLPVLKELVELLFAEGLIKVLIATETFAMGVNMPAKTVLFMDLSKFDGEKLRMITSGEYIQMSGRAGRRGKDKNGKCIVIVDGSVTTDEIRQLLKGEPMPLKSRFRLSYNMLVNLFRVKTTDPKSIVLNSFQQFQKDKARPAIERSINDLETKIEDIQIEDENLVNQYRLLQERKQRLTDRLWRCAMGGRSILPFLQPGRLVFVEERGRNSWGWGVVTNFWKRYNHEEGFVVNVLLRVKKMEYFDRLAFPHPPDSTDVVKVEHKEDVQVVAVMESMITRISSIRIYMPDSLESPSVRKIAQHFMVDAIKNYPPGQIPLLDPIEDLGMSTKMIKAMKETAQQLAQTKVRLEKNAICKIPAGELRTRVKLMSTKSTMRVKLGALRRRLQNSGIDDFEKELERRMRVLRRLHHVDVDGVLQQKGRLACDMDCCHELVATELLLGGITRSMDAAQLVAFFSCLIADTKGKAYTMNPPQDKVLAAAWMELLSTAKNVARIEQESGLDINPENYANSFSCKLVDVTHAWCLGKSFLDVSIMTKMFEGELIRNFRRLDEQLGTLLTVSKTLGDEVLEDKLKKGSQLLKRGIAFASSLYLE